MISWKAHEKKAWESGLRFLIRPILPEIISLDVTHLFSIENLITVSLKLFYVMIPLLVDTSGLFRVERPHI